MYPFLSSPASLLGLIYPLPVPLNFALKLESLEDKKILSGETLIAASEEGTVDSLGTLFTQAVQALSPDLSGHRSQHVADLK